MQDSPSSSAPQFRRAAARCYRVIGEDGWDGSAYPVADYPTFDQAAAEAAARAAAVAPAQARYGDTFFVYDDAGRCLLRVNPPLPPPPPV